MDKQYNEKMNEIFGEGWQDYSPKTIAWHDKDKVKDALLYRYKTGVDSFSSLLVMWRLIDDYPEAEPSEL